MLLYNAEIYSMTDDMHFYGYVEVKDGKIQAVEQGKPDAVTEEDIDCGGGMLMPGLIDAHTHLGIIEDGIDFEGDDCNEVSDPFTPQLRAIDGIDPYDRCFEEARASGITSVMVSPGSANACGGEMLLLKTWGRCTDEMAVRPCGMKFALGENPKSVYNDRDEAPVTRMAIASLIREGLQKAKLYSERLQRFEEHPDEEEHHDEALDRPDPAPRRAQQRAPRHALPAPVETKQQKAEQQWIQDRPTERDAPRQRGAEQQESGKIHRRAPLKRKGQMPRKRSGSILFDRQKAASERADAA